MAGDKRRQYGLGSYPSVLLNGARDKARRYRHLIENGQDPISERRKAKAAILAAHGKAMTFAEAMESVLILKQQELKNKKHAAQWRSTLETYACPVLGPLPVAEIETAHILKVLEPIWSDITETATRVRGRIEKVFDWCQARGYREGNNPARWDGHLKELLPQPTKIRTVRHFASLPYQPLPDFYAALSRKQGLSAKALSFAILTAARSGEVRGASWAEFDLEAKLWTIPAERMKARKEHRVPLSDPAIFLLAGLPTFKGSGLLFPSTHNGPLSDTALLEVLRGMRVDAVPHGFRSTFKTWASEQTHVHRDVIEAALAHTLESKVEEAYQRSDLFEKRRALMAGWAAYCQSAQEEKT